MSLPGPRDPLREAADRVGDRWTLLIVDALRRGPLRFGEVSEAVTDIAPNVLTKRLRQLEADGLVSVTPYSERPRRVSYELTPDGAALRAALNVLAEWGARHTDGEGVETHISCGTPIETRRWCPTCDVDIDNDADDASILL